MKKKNKIRFRKNLCKILCLSVKILKISICGEKKKKLNKTKQNKTKQKNIY